MTEEQLKSIFNNLDDGKKEVLSSMIPDFLFEQEVFQLASQKQNKRNIFPKNIQIYHKDMIARLKLYYQL